MFRSIAVRCIGLTGALSLAACQSDERIASPTDAPPALASSSSLPHINNSSLPLPLSVSADLAAYNCSNNPGPYITFSGLSVLGGFGVQLTFTNNMKGTHQNDVLSRVDATVMPAGETITIPKQPVHGGVGGNPYIWVQFINGDGSAASGEIFLGRCVQGAGWHVTGPSATTVNARAAFEVTSCENSPGPFVSIGSGFNALGLIARVIFRNNDNPVGGPHEAESTADITMIPPGLNYTFPKQPVQGGVGGNPWIWGAFEDGARNVLGQPELMGRCEQLSKALAG